MSNEQNLLEKWRSLPQEEQRESPSKKLAFEV